MLVKESVDMIKLKCDACHEAWLVDDVSINKLQVCPFCQISIRERVGFDTIDSLGKAIYSAIVKSGDEISGSVRLLSAFLYDYTPNLKKEIRIMVRALNGRDATLQKVFSENGPQADLTIAKLKRCLIDEDGIAEPWADQICTALSDALRFSRSDRTTSLTNVTTEDCSFCNEQRSVEPIINSNFSPSAALYISSTRYDILKQYNCKGCGHQIDGFDLVFNGQEKCPVCGECNWAESTDEIRAAVNAALKGRSPGADAFAQSLKNANHLLNHFQIDEALDSYRKLAKNGCPDAFLPTARIYYNAGKYKQAWKWYLEAANAGLGEGLYHVGDFYLNGYYVGKNDHLAVKYFKKAADKGNLDAIELLAQYYMSGEGCERDEVLAREYLSVLAEYNYRNAQFCMGEFLCEAGGVKNTIKAAEYYRRAASNGYSEAKALQDECLRQLPPQAQARAKYLLGV